MTQHPDSEASLRHLLPDRWWETVAGLKIVTLKQGRTYGHELSLDPEELSEQLDQIVAQGFQVIEVFAPAEGLYAYSGLDTTNHYRIDPELGTMDGFRRLVRIAHSKGLAVVIFPNIGYFSVEAPDWITACTDPESEQARWFSWADRPDAPEWRAILRRKVREIVERGVDAIFLDQTGTFINDLRYDHFRGLQALYAELRTDLPDVQFVCEGPTTELSASLSPLLAGAWGGDTEDLAEMYRRLFGPYVRRHSHSASIPPEPYRGVWAVPPGTWWTEDRFVAHHEHAARTNTIPTLNLTDKRVRLDGELAVSVLDRARCCVGPG